MGSICKKKKKMPHKSRETVTLKIVIIISSILFFYFSIPCSFLVQRILFNYCYSAKIFAFLVFNADLASAAETKSALSGRATEFSEYSLFYNKQIYTKPFDITINSFG